MPPNYPMQRTISQRASARCFAVAGRKGCQIAHPSELGRVELSLLDSGATAHITVPTVVTVVSGHVHRNVGHDPELPDTLDRNTHNGLPLTCISSLGTCKIVLIQTNDGHHG